VAAKILIDKQSIHEDPEDTSALLLSAPLQAKLNEVRASLRGVR